MTLSLSGYLHNGECFRHRADKLFVDGRISYIRCRPEALVRPSIVPRARQLGC